MDCQRVLIGTPLVMKRDGQGFELFLKMDRISRNSSSFYLEPLLNPSQHSILCDPTLHSRRCRDILDFSISSFTMLFIQELILILPPVLPIQGTLLLPLHVCLSLLPTQGIPTSVSPCPTSANKKDSHLLCSLVRIQFSYLIQKPKQ